MEKQEKNALLTQLYALRAGMSVISVQKDGVDSLNQDMKSIDRQEERRLETVNANMNAEFKRRREVEDDRLIYEDFPHQAVWLSLAGIIALLGLGYLLILAGTALRNIQFGRTVVIIPGLVSLLGLACYVLAAALAVGAVMLGVFAVGKVIEYVQTKRETLIKESLRPKKLQEIQQSIDKLKKEKNRIQESCNRKREEVLLQIKKKANDCTWVDGALRAQFSKVLDERDWKHVDLILFYFETGRADDLKEALQLVDKQVQNDQILHAIHLASNNICNTIQEGMMGLQSSMVKCFSLLSEQLISIQQAQQAQIEDLTGNLKALVNATNLNSALQEKANRSSLQLAEDMRYMRGAVERQEITIRNRA